MRKIIVYSTPSCPYCDDLKSYLLQKGLEFEEYDVSNDKEKAADMVRKSGRGAVPVIEIDGIVVVGFDRPKIEKILSGMIVDRSTAMKNLVFDPFDQ